MPKNPKGTQPKPNYHEPDLFRGNSPFAVKHAFVSNFILELPFGQGRRFGGNFSGVAEHVLGGWQLGGIVTLTSGPPGTYTQTTRNDLRQLGVNHDYPDILPGASPKILEDPDQWFDTAAFVHQGRTSRVISNSSRTSMRGPGVANVDFSLTKSTHVTEAVNLQVRFEFFNVFNRPNFALPSNNIFDSQGRLQPSAGRINGTTQTMREAQIGLRIVF